MGLVLFVPGFALAVSAGLVVGMLIVGDLASDRGWIAAALIAAGLALLLPAGLLYGSARQKLENPQAFPGQVVRSQPRWVRKIATLVMVGGAIGLAFSGTMSVLKLAGYDDAPAWPAMIAHIGVNLSLFTGGFFLRRLAKSAADKEPVRAPLAASNARRPDDVRRGKSVANEEGQEP